MLGRIIKALAWVYHHQQDLEDAAELGIHIARRIEHLQNKHNATIDDILVAADEALSPVPPQPPVNR